MLELAERINSQLGGIEEIIDLDKKYNGICIVKVVECSPIEGTDHLNVTKIDDGGLVQGIERDKNGFVQVVCGASNVHADMFAVWLAPGLTVPETYDDTEPFVLGAKQLRGVMSSGMLASPKELGFGDMHDGILEIDPSEWKPTGIDIQPGTSFAEAYGLDDTVIDIENKMFTHRPDCFGQLGVAREIAGIQGNAFKSPEWYKPVVEFANGQGLGLEVQNDVTEKVPRFMAVAIKGVSVKPSPVWLQAELVRLGSKPINNIVDVTNYVMLLTAQPMHAYDYDKLSTGKLGVRMARDKETLTLLGGKTIVLDDADIVITDGEKPVGLGGVMGGSETEVSLDTKNIVLECANFDMYTVRRTSMRHGLFTDAVTRFTKGQSPLQNPAALALAIKSVLDTAGGEQASDVIDNHNLHTSHGDSIYGTQVIDTDFINWRLGLSLPNDDIATLLSNVEFVIGERGNENIINYTAPFWRTDIEIAEDVVEEVGRLYGFDKLSQELPRRSIFPAPVSPSRLLKSQLRNALSRAGANEVLTYSFVHKTILDKAGQDADDAYRLSNALSPDLQYYRLTLLPSLLDKVHMNVRAGYNEFALFEIGKGHSKAAGRDDQGVPFEQEYISLTLVDGGFYRAKRLLDFMAQSVNSEFSYSSISDHKLFEPKRSALVLCGGKAIGTIGEYRSSVRRGFKLPDGSAGFEIDLSAFQGVIETTVKTYKPLSKFPSAERDITLQVVHTLNYIDVAKAVEQFLSSTGLTISIVPLGIYKPESVGTKNITLRITLSSHDKTLTGDEVGVVMDALATVVSEKLRATTV